MNFSTTTINPSYVFAPAVLFFVGIMDVLPIYKKALLPKWIAHLMIGLSIGWIMQLHMSWVLLPFYVFTYGLWLLFRRRFRDVGIAVLGIGSGFIIGISTLIPTIAKYPDALLNAESVVVFNPANFKNIDMISRFLSFTSAEILTFAEGMEGFKSLLSTHPWSIPFLIFLLVMGYVQMAYFIWNFVRPGQKPEFQRVRAFAMCTMLLLYVAYLFAVREVANYTIYVVAPAALIYGVHALDAVFNFKWIKWTGVALLVSSVVFHTVMSLYHFDERSLHSREERIKAAIEEMDSRKFAYRRVANWERDYRKEQWSLEQDSNKIKIRNNFDNYPEPILPETLVLSGDSKNDFILQVDSLFPFGETCEIHLDELAGKRHLQVAVVAKTNCSDKALICIACTKNDSVVHWRAHPIISNNSSDSLSCYAIKDSIPEEFHNEDMMLSINTWIPKANKSDRLWIDNFEIVIE